MKICVTGGTGFIGHKVVSRLLALGVSVVVPTRKQAHSLPEKDGLLYVDVDLLEGAPSIEKCLVGCDVVINCAGEIKDSSKMHGLHVLAMQKLLTFFLVQCKEGAYKGRWVQLSSVGAYGPAFPANAIRVVTEDFPLSPVGEYEISKAKADTILINAAQAYPDSFTYVILRPSNVCGPDMPNNALRAWALAIKNKIFFFVGGKAAISTYIHVDDVVDALIKCAMLDSAKNQTINLSNDCSQFDLVGAMAQAVGSSSPSLCIPEWIARSVARLFDGIERFPLKASRIDSLVARTRYPNDKARRVLGIEPKRYIPDAIREIIRS